MSWLLHRPNRKRFHTHKFNINFTLLLPLQRASSSYSEIAKKSVRRIHKFYLCVNVLVVFDCQNHVGRQVTIFVNEIFVTNAFKFTFFVLSSLFPSSRNSYSFPFPFFFNSYAFFWRQFVFSFAFILSFS